jgi:DNA-binding SARP family transcriptional activator
MTVRVRLLGPPRIEEEDGQPRRPARGQKSWALLARLAMAERPLSRSELAAELFAEADDPLGALRWCLADLRRCCDDPGLARGDPVSLADRAPWIDVRALLDGSLPAGEIGGELLAGVEPRNCPAFDMWLMLARGRCAARSMEELRQGALRLLAVGDFEAAAELAGRAAARDPLDEGAQEMFLRALVAAGHPARAAVPAGVRRLALVYQAEAGDLPNPGLGLVRALAGQVTNPALQARAAALGATATVPNPRPMITKDLYSGVWPIRCTRD